MNDRTKQGEREMYPCSTGNNVGGGRGVDVVVCHLLVGISGISSLIGMNVSYLHALKFHVEVDLFKKRWREYQRSTHQRHRHGTIVPLLLGGVQHSRWPYH